MVLKIIYNKLEFFKTLNSNFSLSNEEENLIVDMNQIIMNSFHENQNIRKDNSENNCKIKYDVNQSQLIETYLSTLKDVEITKEFLHKVKNEIDDSFLKLNSILDSRNELSNILKEFNNSTKTIINEKEKILKLKSSIEKMYKMYDETLSIEAFFEHSKDECVEKLRFTSDYEEIEKGINFFSLNSNYVEAEKYLNTYNMLKRIAITRYYNYVSNSLQSYVFDGIEVKEEFFNFNMQFLPKNINKKFYNFPKNIEKIKSVQKFFESKSEYDYEVRRIVESVKQKYIDHRINIFRPFYEEIIGILKKGFASEGEHKFISAALSAISKVTIIEILFFCIIFQTKPSDNTYILQKLTSELYSTLYNNLRPLIITSDNLDLLFTLFDSFSESFGIFFVDVNENNLVEINSRIFSYYSINENEFSYNTDIIINILKISKILIRPNILKLIQDVQEKIFFKINLHLKTNFIELEDEFQNLSLYEERTSPIYKDFSLFHFFLRRMSIILEILKNKLDKQVLNELTVSAIEKFLAILNDEIFNKKNLTFEFEIYIIQQIILAIKLLEDFDVEAVESGVDIDFYSITDIFKNNLNIKDILINSAPKLYDKSRDFRKILYNNLLKSYKILLNLINELIFGRDIMDVIYKIRNKEKIDDKLLELRLKDKKNIFIDIFVHYESILKEINSQLRIIDLKISEKLYATILENILNILNQLRATLIGKEGQFDEILSMLDFEVISRNFNEIKNSTFN